MEAIRKSKTFEKKIISEIGGYLKNRNLAFNV